MINKDYKDGGLTLRDKSTYLAREIARTDGKATVAEQRRMMDLATQIHEEAKKVEQVYRKRYREGISRQIRYSDAARAAVWVLTEMSIELERAHPELVTAAKLAIERLTAFDFIARDEAREVGEN